MPGMNGRKVEEHLHTLREGTKILFMPVRPNEQIFSRDGLCTEIVFLTKHFYSETLLRKALEMLGT
jgi:hypothetical protein